MPSITSLLLTVIGIVLLALDRVVGKGTLLKVDNTLKAMVRRFRPLRGSPYQLAFIFLATLFFARIGGPQFRAALLASAADEQRDALLFFIFDNWKWFLPLVLYVEGCVMGAFEWLRQRNEPLVSWGQLAFSLLYGAFVLVYFAVSGVVGLLHFLLWPLMYPLKGVLLFEKRLFHSFSGVIGLVAALTGTILQFLGL